MSSVVNRFDRNALVAVVNEYLRDEITAFVLDTKLSELEARTSDPTVQWVRAQLWGCYDDCEDHLVIGDKPEWDLIQRLLLLLKSDASVVSDTRPARWTARRASGDGTLRRGDATRGTARTVRPACANAYQHRLVTVHLGIVS